MNLNEYIKRNYKNPNVQVLKTLNASDSLISYLTHTPWNTNLRVVESLGGGGNASQYTFHFIQGEYMFGDQVQSGLIIDDTTEFEAMWDTIGNGRILDFEIKNVEMLDGTVLDFTIEDGEKDIEFEDGMLVILKGNAINLFECYMIPKNSSVIQEGYPSIGLLILASNGETLIPASCDLVISVLDGYVIKACKSEPGTIPEVENETLYYFIKKGESFTPGLELTDGTNIYHSGDTIIPTSDMELTIIKSNGGNQ